MLKELADAGKYINNCTQSIYAVDNKVQALAQVLCVAEEAGEFVGAVRRNMGLARRNGSMQDVEDELADVIISAFVAGAALNIDIEKAIKSKLDKVMSRGWKE